MNDGIISGNNAKIFVKMHVIYCEIYRRYPSIHYCNEIMFFSVVCTLDIIYNNLMYILNLYTLDSVVFRSVFDISL